MSTEKSQNDLRGQSEQFTISSSTEPTEVKISKVEKLRRKKYISLELWEMLTYIVIWILPILYATYSFYIESRNNKELLLDIHPYNPWWNPVGMPLYLDRTDHEWNTWKQVSSHPAFVLVLLYPVMSQIVKKYSSAFTVHFSALLSVMTTMYLIGVLPVLFLFIQIFVIFLTYRIFSAGWAVWAVAVAMGQCPDFYPLKDLRDMMFTTYEAWSFGGYLTAITYAWINTRCVSFCLDRLWNRVERENSLVSEFINLTAFCFYLPLGIMGPLITSKQFKDGLQKSSIVDWNLIKFTLLQTARFLFWYCTAELLLCAFYQQAHSYKPTLVKTMGMWSLCGMSYLLGQFFQLKYFVMYGVSSLLATLDNMDAPPPPKCIARIHLYSDMWRHFDVGLYHFMHTYIYQPIISFNNGFLVKTITSILTFGFVYVWHGRYDFVLIWSVLNCAGVLFESIGREVGRRREYAEWEAGVFGERGQRRFHAIISTPIYLMSCLSNFYFFTGKEVGDIILRRCFFDMWPYGFPSLIVVMYCGCHFSIEVKNWEIEREIRKIGAKTE